MNKKLLAGIIAGAVALLAVVFVLCAGIFNWFHWDWFAAKDDPSSQSETVSDGYTVIPYGAFDGITVSGK